MSIMNRNATATETDTETTAAAIIPANNHKQIKNKYKKKNQEL